MTYTFDYLKLFHFDAPLFGFKRTDKTNNEYNEHLRYLKTIKKSTSQHIYDLYFKNNNNLFCFVENKYAYDVENNITHMLLWFNPDLPYPIWKDINYVKKILAMYLKNDNYVTFMNHPSCQTVPEIKHYHVFVLR